MRLGQYAFLGLFLFALHLFSIPQIAHCQVATDTPTGNGSQASLVHPFLKRMDCRSVKGSFLPNCVAVDHSGNVLVGGVSSDRIEIFDPNGRYVKDVSCGPAIPGKVEGPVAIAVDASNNIYVADYSGSRVQKFTPDGHLLVQFGSAGTEKGQFDYLTAIVVDQQGDLYVADSGRVQKFDPSGIFLSQWGEKVFLGEGLPLDKRPKGAFSGINGMVMDSKGFLYVMEGGVRIQKFTPEGAWVNQWGGQGNGKGSFYMPTGMAMGSDDHIFVVEPYANRIQEFDPDGHFVTQWGSEGNGTGFLHLPMGIGTDPAGNIYVADTQHNCVQEFGRDLVDASLQPQPKILGPAQSAFFFAFEGNPWSALGFMVLVWPYAVILIGLFIAFLLALALKAWRGQAISFAAVLIGVIGGPAVCFGFIYLFAIGADHGLVPEWFSKFTLIFFFYPYLITPAFSLAGVFAAIYGVRRWKRRKVQGTITP
jgi:DNA-binding beta-propeller fold protein YncE